MAEAIHFVLRVFIKQGLWIAGLACLLAVGGWILFVRDEGSAKSDEDAPELLRRKALLGMAILVVGILIAL